jgi:site-specific DNA-methyltransferase (adenine-specific)
MTFNQSDPAKYNETKNAQDIVITSPEAQQWAGWKTALKPAHEPIVMARKPMKGSTIDNVLTHGVGALNIDATRIPFEKKNIDGMKRATGSNSDTFRNFNPEQRINKDQAKDMEHGLTEVVYTPNEQGRYPSNVLGDIADYQKYFYCPKVSRRERHRGFEQEHIPDPLENYAQGDVKNHPLWDPSIGTNIQRLKHKILEHDKSLGRAHTVTQAVGNNHPTVKPVELMKYLIRLVTPAEAHILDPFAGSGTTGMACRELARRFTGIDLDRDYCEIARKRIAASQPDLSETLFE